MNISSVLDKLTNNEPLTASEVIDIFDFYKIAEDEFVLPVVNGFYKLVRPTSDDELVQPQRVYRHTRYKVVEDVTYSSSKPDYTEIINFDDADYNKNVEETSKTIRDHLYQAKCFLDRNIELICQDDLYIIKPED
jgi:hypothetical protein